MADVTGTIDVDFDGMSIEVTGKVTKTGTIAIDCDGMSIEVDVTPEVVTGSISVFLDI